MGNECGRESAADTALWEDSQSYVFESTSDKLADKEISHANPLVNGLLKPMAHIHAAASTIAVPATEKAQRVVAQVTEAHQAARGKATSATDRLTATAEKAIGVAAQVS